ncbi:hypothetical protein P0Y35_00040 [Kiritimatiellaeota bacterium B1221]|nr:hypothetical protein [Kiritimatiellaeota bacterium B1221]
MKSKWVQWSGAVLCAAVAALCFTGRVDPWIQRAGLGKLEQQNNQYLAENFEKALSGFGVMSGLKAGLAVVEGSTGGVNAGVSLQLQIGDVVQSAYDYVDIAWRTLLLGSICLLSMQYLLEVAGFLGQIVLGLFFVWLAMGCVWRHPPQVLRDIGILTGFAGWVLYLFLPLSILAASALSQQITQPTVDAAQAGFAEAGETLFPDNQSLDEGMLARIKQIPERLEQISNYLRQKASEMSLWTVQLIAGYLFDCIFFPLGCFLLMLFGSRACLRYGHQCSVHERLLKELAKLKMHSNGD